MEFYFKALAYLAVGALLGYAVFLIFLESPKPAFPPVPTNADYANETLAPILETGIVNLTMIEAPDCDICNAEGLMLEQVKIILLQSEFLRAGSARRIPASSTEARALISKYGIATLPAVVIEGEVARDAEFVLAWKETVGTLEDNRALVSRVDYPPYYDLENGTVVGLVEGIGIKASGCLECGDPALFLSSLEASPVAMAFTNTTIYDENDSRAQALIAQYNITKLPTLFLSEKGASAYPVFEQIRLLGAIEDGWFILRDVVPPYVDLADNRSVRGLVAAVYLVNSSCEDCLDISSLSEYLSEASGVIIVDEKTHEIDSAQGMELVQRYNITKIPTLIFSNEVRYYYKFEEAWAAQNNTVEEDGSFVFRAHNLLGGAGYQDLGG